MTQAILEMTTFRLKPGTDLGAFLAAAKGADAYMERCGGFRDHRLSRAEDGTFTHAVGWADAASARAAMAGFMAAPETGAFMAFIDEASVAMSHQPILSESA